MKALKWGLVVAVAAVAGWAGLEYGRWSRGPILTGPESNGASAQLLATPLISPSGQARKLSDWQGRIMVVNFWATWCPPCLEEMPEFSRAQDQYGPDGVQFVGIAIDDSDNVVKFSAKTPVVYPLLLGPPDLPALMARLGNQQQVLPFTVIIGRDGKLHSSHIGRLTKEDLGRQLAPVL